MRLWLLIFGLFLSLSRATDAALPMADFLDAPPGDEEQAVLGNEDEAVDRWEALPLPISEADLARDSDIVLRDDEAGSGSLARREIHQKNEEEAEEEAEIMTRDFENLQADLSSEKVLEEDDVFQKKTKEDFGHGGLLEIYNVDDFDEKHDDEAAKESTIKKETL